MSHPFQQWENALKFMSEAQEDVKELVSKWKEMLNTVPHCVEFHFFDGSMYSIPNFAMIQERLTAYSVEASSNTVVVRDDNGGIAAGSITVNSVDIDDTSHNTVLNSGGVFIGGEAGAALDLATGLALDGGNSVYNKDYMKINGTSLIPQSVFLHEGIYAIPSYQIDNSIIYATMANGQPCYNDTQKATFVVANKYFEKFQVQQKVKLVGGDFAEFEIDFSALGIDLSSLDLEDPDSISQILSDYENIIDIQRALDQPVLGDLKNIHELEPGDQVVLYRYNGSKLTIVKTWFIIPPPPQAFLSDSGGDPVIRLYSMAISRFAAVDGEWRTNLVSGDVSVVINKTNPDKHVWAITNAVPSENSLVVDTLSQYSFDFNQATSTAWPAPVRRESVTLDYIYKVGVI